MVWPIVAAIGFSALSGGAQAESQNAAARADYINKLNANVATNEAIGEANILNTIRTGYRVGILNVQRGETRKQFAEQKFKVTQIAQEVLSATTANAGAAGTIGASVEAVADDIRKRGDEAIIDANANWQTEQFNFDTQLNDIITAGLDSLRSPVMMDYTGVSQRSVTGAALGSALSTAVSLGAGYMMQGANLGLGAGASGSGVGGFFGAGGTLDAATNAMRYGGSFQNWSGVTNLG